VLLKSFAEPRAVAHEDGSQLVLMQRRDADYLRVRVKVV
jgi:hypothetical protein